MQAGILTVSSGIDPKNRFLAEKTILEQLTDLQNGSITHAELHAAKLSLDNAYRQLEDNPFELQTFFGNRGLFGLSLDPEECRRKLHAVSVEEIVSVARKVTYDASFFIDTVSASDTQEEPSHE